MKYYKLISRLTFITFFSLLSSMVYSEESSSKFNVYSGMFDFSDTGKKSTLIGFQHQNEDLNRDTFLGNLSPITGALLTADSAAYIYTGVQAQYKLGRLILFQALHQDYIAKEMVKIWAIFWNLKVSYKFQ